MIEDDDLNPSYEIRLCSAGEVFDMTDKLWTEARPKKFPVFRKLRRIHRTIMKKFRNWKIERYGKSGKWRNRGKRFSNDPRRNEHKNYINLWPLIYFKLQYFTYCFKYFARFSRNPTNNAQIMVLIIRKFSGLFRAVGSFLNLPILQEFLYIPCGTIR